MAFLKIKIVKWQINVEYKLKADTKSYKITIISEKKLW